MKKKSARTKQSHRGVLEKELKYNLTRTGYLRLLKKFERRASKRLRLATHYFEHPKLLLRARGIGFRVRIADGTSAFLTLKHPPRRRQEGLAAYRIRHEYEEEIPLQDARALISGRKHLLDLKSMPIDILREIVPHSSFDRLAIIGAMFMTRTKVRLDKSTLLEIDRYRIFGKNFYELEIETNKPKTTDARVRVVLAELKIPYEPSRQSKLARFLEEWRNQS